MLIAPCIILRLRVIAPTNPATIYWTTGFIRNLHILRGQNFANPDQYSIMHDCAAHALTFEMVEDNTFPIP